MGAFPFELQNQIDPGQPMPRVTQSGSHYNESCLKKVQGDKTNYKPAIGNLYPKQNRILLMTTTLLQY